MSIRVKKNYLIFKDKQFQCSIGRAGFSKEKKEGDGCTPVGTFHVKRIFYRDDRIKNLDTNIDKIIINQFDGWCDDPGQKEYNQLIKFPYNFSAERLYRNDSLYNIVCVLNYNTNPIRKNKGSAIFIHIAKKNYKSTAGCIAVSKKNLREIIKNINKKTTVNIN